MFIANPIYDTVFKFLMEDLEVAKRLISIIIDEQILDLEVLPQEFATFYQKVGVSILRLDFKAIIKTKNGDPKKVLIELQKSKNALDIRRFRRYLGENYTRIDHVGKKKESLPIITIYFLGFDLSVQVPILHINRVYRNRVTGEEVQGKDEFIEKLTHDSYIIQIPLLPTQTQSKVEKILSVFNQKWIYDQDSRWLMTYDDSLLADADVELIAKRLEHAAQDPETRDQTEMENELEEGLDQKFTEKEEKIEALENLLEESEIERVKAKQEAEEAKKIAQQQAQEIENAQKIAQQQAQEIENLRKQLQQNK